MWNETGKISDKGKDKLKIMAEKAKDKGYILRFWGTPNRMHVQKIATWELLHNAGVSLIGADDLTGLQHFFMMDE